MKTIFIAGATSAIAQATARQLCNQQARFFLVGRDAEKLAIVKEDLLMRGAHEVSCDVRDLTEIEQHDSLVEKAVAMLGRLDLALIAYGDLPDQTSCEKSAQETMKSIMTNGSSVISLSTVLSTVFEGQRSGCLAVITSVAGDRGRQSNYVYGAAKGGVTIFLQGLRNRLSKLNVNVITIKPGFVDTPMTEGFEKSALWASPEQIAKGIIKAIDRKSDVVYLPWFWRWVMLIIRSIPEVIFKKLSL